MGHEGCGAVFGERRRCFKSFLLSVSSELRMRGEGCLGGLNTDQDPLRLCDQDHR